MINNLKTIEITMKMKEHNMLTISLINYQYMKFTKTKS